MPITAEQQAILDECDLTNAALRRKGLFRASTPAYASAVRGAGPARPAPRQQPAAALDDYTQEFLAKLSARAGIPASTDPDKILAALDLRLYALTPKQDPQQQADAALDAQIDALFTAQAAPAKPGAKDDVYDALFGTDAR